MGARLLTEAKKNDKLVLLRSLYNNYGAMLLGYLFEIVKDQGVAEQYLVEIFDEIAVEPDQYYLNGSGAFGQLQKLARKKLTPFYKTIDYCAVPQDTKNATSNSNNKYLHQMTLEQLHVFCGLHYHGKNTAVLAAELGKPENDIRKILKESFTLIRKSHGHTRLH
jgi:hypothetical protein